MPEPITGILGLLGAGTALFSANAQEQAAEKATTAQVQSAQAGIDEQRRQFDAVQQLLSPFVSGGEGALSGQLALLGLSGPDAEQQAIDRISGSPTFGALVESGERSILANASATGGLRGGNTQGALAQFSPQLLQQQIQQQFSNLGGLTNLGQSSAAGVGAAGQAAGANISQLMQQQGAAQAGGALAQGQARANLAGNFGNIAGFIGGNIPMTSSLRQPLF